MSGHDDTHLIGDKWGRIKNIDICSEAEPTTTWPYMMWIKPSTAELKVRNKADTAWVGVGGAGGGGAPTTAQYLVLALNGDLTAERRFVDGDGLTGVDGGADGDYTLAVDATVVRTSGAQTIAGAKILQDNLTLDDGVVDSPLLRFVGGSGDVITIGLDDEGAGDSDLEIRLAGSTSDSSRFEILQIGGGLLFSVSSAGQLLSACDYLTLEGGLTAYDVAAPIVAWYLNSALTNTLGEIARLGIASSGVIAAGFGAYLRFDLEDDGGAYEEAARISVEWEAVDHASPESNIRFWVRPDGALAETLRVDQYGLWMALDKIIDMDELAAAPANPAANRRRIYPKSDGFYQLDAAGVETPLSGGAAVNLLTNGGHEIWQRGAGAFVTSGGYAADRWELLEVGGDSLSVTPDGANKKTNSLYASAIVFTLVGGAGATQYRQELVIADNFHGLLGETISFRASVALAGAVANAVRAFITTDGTGGVTTYSSYHGNDTNWEDLDVVGVTVPSDATFIFVGLAFDVSCTAYMDNCMFVVASAATDYVALAPADEWERCQRYYEVHGGVSGTMQIIENNGVGGSTIDISVIFSTRKAIAPTLTKLGTWATARCNQPTVQSPSFCGYQIRAATTAGGVQTFYPDTADDLVTSEANP